MDYLIPAGIIGAILLIVKYMMGRARTDAFVSDVEYAEAQKKKQAYEKEAAALAQEIENAKIDYTRIRDGLNTSSSDDKRS